MQGTATAYLPPLPSTMFVFYDSEDCRVYLVGGTPVHTVIATDCAGHLLGRPFERECPDFMGTGMDALRARGELKGARALAASLRAPLYVDGFPVYVSRQSG
jgi:hypothetical protein